MTANWQEDALERALGYRFRDRGLLAQALTHPSSGVQPDNQRLEFLGDALLNAATTLLLFREKPDWPEGAMTKLGNYLVSTESLCLWASDLKLSLRLPQNADPRHLKTSFRKPLADAMEAILAAVFLDACAVGEDALAAVERIVVARFLEPIRQAGRESWKVHDPKTALQEWAMARGLSLPVYENLGQSGPDHAPEYRICVHCGDHQATATGKTRKLAQTEAARILLRNLDPS